MVILNFGHPLTEAQRAQIEHLTGSLVERVVEAPTQFDAEKPFAPQIKTLFEQTGLTSTEWQTLPLLLNLPSLNVIAALMLAELHGRCGYFPAILRLRPIAGSTPPRFEVAEVLNLQAVRDAARAAR